MAIKMILREAKIEDITEILIVRNSVTENKLSNPDAVTNEDCVAYLSERGKGWVCECDDKIVGFSIVDLKENNVWALFIRPEYEKLGIGKQLHDILLHWYFRQDKESIWLGTSPNTRAEGFYRKMGWTENGKHSKNEIKFEMTNKEWNERN